MKPHEAECPTCHYYIAAHRQMNGRKKDMPHHEDVTVCPQCTSFLKYNKDLTLHLLTAEEIATLSDAMRNTLFRLRRMAKESECG
jgi:hypothetical protein